jgi:hypothetical protein
VQFLEGIFRAHGIKVREARNEQRVKTKERFVPPGKARLVDRRIFPSRNAFRLRIRWTRTPFRNAALSLRPAKSRAIARAVPLDHFEK